MPIIDPKYVGRPLNLKPGPSDTPWADQAASAWAGYKSGWQANINELFPSDENQLDLQELRDRQQYYAARAASGGIPQRLEDVKGVGGFGRWLGGQAINSAPYLGEAAIGGVAGRAIGGALGVGSRAAAGTAGAVGASYPSAVGDVLNNQYEQAGVTDGWEAAALGVPYAALNALGIEGVVGRMGLPATNAASRLGRVAAGAAITGGGEVINEVGQEMLNQAGRIGVDPTAEMFSDEALSRYKNAAVAAGFLGGALGGAPKVFSRDPSSLLAGTNPPPAPATTNAAPQPAVQSPGEPQGPMWQYELPLEGGSGGRPEQYLDNLEEDQAAAQLQDIARERQGLDAHVARVQQEIDAAMRSGDTTRALMLMQSVAPYQNAAMELNARERVLASRMGNAQGLVPGRVSGSPGQLSLFPPEPPSSPLPPPPPAPPSQVEKTRLAQGTVLGAPPVANTQAQLLTSPRVPPQPGAGGIITPNQRSTIDQRIDAQRKQARGELLSPYERFLVDNPPAGPDVEVASAAPPRAGFQLRGEPTPQFDQPQTTRPDFELTSDNQPSLFGEEDLRDLDSRPEWKDDVRRVYTQAGGRDYKGIAKVLQATDGQSAAAAVRERLENGAKPDAWEALHQHLTGMTASEFKLKQEGVPKVEATQSKPESKPKPAPIAEQTPVVKEVSPLPRDPTARKSLIDFYSVGKDQFLSVGGARQLGIMENNGQWWVLDTATNQPVGKPHKDLRTAKAAAREELSPRDRNSTAEDRELLKDAIERMDTAKDAKAYMDAVTYVYEVAQGKGALAEQAQAALADVPKSDVAKAKKTFEMREKTVARVLKSTAETPQGQGIGAARTREVVKLVTDRWSNLPEIVVVDGLDSPEIAPYRSQLDETTEGFYAKKGDKEVIYLLGDQIGSGQRAIEVIAHEITGHFGLRSIVSDIDTLMNQYYLGNAKLRAQADAKIDAAKAKDQTLTKEEAMEEVLADMSQRGDAPTLLDKLILAVQRAFAALGVDFGITQAQARELVGNARRWVIYGDGTKVHSASKAESVVRRSTTPQQAAQKTVSVLQDVLFDSKVKLSEWGKYARTNLQLEAAYKKMLPSLTPFVQITRAMVAYANQHINPVIEIERDLNTLTTGERTELADVAFDSTLAEIDPAETFESQTHLKEDQRPEYERLRAKWLKLDKKIQKLYIRMRDHLAATWAKRIELSKSNVKGHFDLLIKQQTDPKEIAQLEAELKEELEKRDSILREIKGPYFPLMRFGRYVAVAKSTRYLQAEAALKGVEEEVFNLRTAKAKQDVLDAANTKRSAAREALAQLKKSAADYRVEAYERPSERERAIEQMTREGFNTVLPLNSEDYLREVSALHHGFLSRIKESADVALPKEAASKVREVIHELYIHSMPEMSAMRRQLRREGVQGFSKDLTRVFVATSLRDAHYLSRLAYNDKLMDSLATMRREAKNTTEPMDVYNQMANRFAAQMQYVETPILNALSNFNFIMYLGLSPAFLLTNLMQTPMITGPMLSARYGYTQSYGAIAKAFGETSKALKASFMKDRLRMQLNLDVLQGSGKGEVEMLRKLFNDGVIDFMMEHDLGTTARGNSNMFRRLSRGMAYFAHHSEMVNRVTTALAAYRLARQGNGASMRPMGHEEAITYAQKVIDETHLDYSPENAPYFMRPSVFRPAKVIFQFKKYQQGMIWLLASNFKNAFLSKDASALEKREARRFLFGVLVSQQLVTGTLGLPLAFPIGVLAEVVAKVFGDPEKEFDPEIWWRQFLADMMGVELGQIAAKGLPSLLGMDLRNLGMGDILNPMGRMNSTGKEGREYFKEALYGALGPLGGQLGDKFEAWNYFEQGDVLKGVELSVPRFIASPLRTLRFNTEGVTTKSGNVSLEPERFDAWDVVLQSMGFTPSQVSEYYAASSAKESQSAARDDYRKKLLRRWAEAKDARDRGALKSVEEKIAEFNGRNPANKITESVKLRSWEQRRRYQSEKNSKGVRVAEYETDLAAETDFANVEEE